MQLRARPSLRDASLGLSPLASRCYASKLAVRSLLTISSPGALPHHPRPSAWRVASRLSCTSKPGVTTVTVRHGDRPRGGPRGRDAYAAADSDDGEGDALARVRVAEQARRGRCARAGGEHPRPICVAAPESETLNCVTVSTCCAACHGIMDSQVMCIDIRTTFWPSSVRRDLELSRTCDDDPGTESRDISSSSRRQRHVLVLT